MKGMKKLSAILLAVILCAGIMNMPVFAATASQDGLEVTLTTDKDEYSQGEEITATLTVKNTNDYAVTNVSLEGIVPKGYELANDAEAIKKEDTLAAGQTLGVTLTYIAEGAVSTEDDNQDTSNSSSVDTGDENNIVLWGCLLIIAFGGIIVAVAVKKRGKKLLSILLCITIAGTGVVGPSIEANAAGTEVRKVEVETSVQIEGKETVLKAEVSYQISDKDQTECTVTFNSNGGSEVKSQSVKKGDAIVKPENPVKTNCAFIGWYADEQLTERIDFDTLSVDKDMTLYAYWLEVAEEKDSDNDEIGDELEELLGIDPTTDDTDNDGLSDYLEIDKLYLDPKADDTDKDRILDGEEDNDGDGLTNLEEVKYGTDPAVADSDSDGLNDYDEMKVHGTDSLKADSDSDGVSDGKEIELGTDPLKAETKFRVVQCAADNNEVTASVDIELSGEQVETLGIEAVDNQTLFPQDMPGYLGKAYDFSVEGSFDTATIRFEFDSSILEKGADPAIFYYNEEKQTLEELKTTINGNIASADVEHFSKYILIDRKVFYGSFEWEDTWDTEGIFHSVEVVLVVDDSGSMDWNDSNNQRLSVAQELINKLPEDSKIGVVKFESSTSLLTTSLTPDRETAKAYLTTDYFYSNGGTYMYDAINDSFALYESEDETTLKMMIVLSDGDAADTGLHSSTIKAAMNNNVRIYTVGLGNSTSYFNRYLKPLAENTNGAFYLATNAAELASIYEDINKKIDLEADDDGDGIPNYYEENMVAFNGSRILMDKSKPDTDGDGLLDGEEVSLNYEYKENNTKVCVTGKMSSNPALIDSDGDGLYDNAERTGYKTSKNSCKEYVVAPKDPEPLKYTGPAGMWKAHIAEQQDASKVAGSYTSKKYGLDFDLPEWADELIVDAALYLQTLVTSDGWTQSGIESYISDICTVIKYFCGTEAHAVIGAYILNFVPDNLDIAYHSQPDTWQRDYGYNDFYDSVFRIGSNMMYEPVKFNVGGTEYVVWMWKGDYWNLQTGAEIGLYIYDHTSSGEKHYNTVDYELPMTLSLYNYYGSNNVENVFSWAPEVKQWWVTGFNTDFEDPEPREMVSVGSIDFESKPALYNALRDTVANNNRYSQHFIFEEDSHTVWIMWR